MLIDQAITKSPGIKKTENLNYHTKTSPNIEEREKNHKLTYEFRSTQETLAFASEYYSMACPVEC